MFVGYKSNKTFYEAILSFFVINIEAMGKYLKFNSNKTYK